MTEYKTCKHIHDTGYFCQSAAVTGRDYCRRVPRSSAAALFFPNREETVESDSSH